MKNYFLCMVAVLLFTTSCSGKKESVADTNGEITLITLDPGHFHAALIQKSSYPQVSNDVYVYAPAGEDLQQHLQRIEGYNSRSDSPTHWNEIVYTGPDFLQKMLEEKKGNVMVTAGNNGKKTDYIKQTLSQGIHVLADKPMAINTADFELLQECFRIAAQNDILLYDIMTERFEISTILQKEFSQIPAVYGEQLSGTPENPGIVKESVHHFLKTVSGNPLIRPAWFFDVEQQGTGIVDVTTHLVDLVQWECFPGQIIDYKKDIDLLDANYWSTQLSPEQFKEVTGLNTYPDYLQKDVKDNVLHVYANGDITYKIKDIHAKVSVIWNYSFPEGGGDTHYSIMRGSKANLVIEQGEEQGYQPVLSIHAAENTNLEEYESLLTKALERVAQKYPGIGLDKVKEGVWVIKIPEMYHVGHEAHFGQVAENFLNYLQEGKLPDWEVPNMITKYYVTTQALEMARNKK